jgi:hypothetical protein
MLWYEKINVFQACEHVLFSREMGFQNIQNLLPLRIGKPANALLLRIFRQYKLASASFTIFCHFNAFCDFTNNYSKSGREKDF